MPGDPKLVKNPPSKSEVLQIVREAMARNRTAIYVVLSYKKYKDSGMEKDRQSFQGHLQLWRAKNVQAVRWTHVDMGTGTASTSSSWTWSSR